MNKKRVLMLILFLGIMFIVPNVMAYECENGLDYVACGTGVNASTGIPAAAPRLISFAVALMRILIPVVLIIVGTIEMFKSIISGNPDNIAKCRKRVLGKYIGALLAFFIISFVTNIVKLVARGNEKSVAAACFNCYLNNKCNDTELACMGTADEKSKYLNRPCENITVKDECPLDRCKWDTNHCYTPDPTIACRDIDFNNCPEDRCMKDYQTTSCVDKKACNKYEPEACPSDRCTIRYDGSTKTCVDK